MATDPEAKAMFYKMSKCLSQDILTAPDKDIFEVMPASDFDWKAYKESYLKLN